MKLFFIILLLSTTFSLADVNKYFRACINKINANKLESYRYYTVTSLESRYTVRWNFVNAKKANRILSKEAIKERAIEFCKSKIREDFLLEETVELFSATVNGLDLYFVKLHVKEYGEFIGARVALPHVIIPVNKDGEILCEIIASPF